MHLRCGSRRRRKRAVARFPISARFSDASRVVRRYLTRAMVVARGKPGREHKLAGRTNSPVRALHDRYPRLVRRDCFGDRPGDRLRFAADCLGGRVGPSGLADRSDCYVDRRGHTAHRDRFARPVVLPRGQPKLGRPLGVERTPEIASEPYFERPVHFALAYSYLITLCKS